MSASGMDAVLLLMGEAGLGGVTKVRASLTCLLHSAAPCNNRRMLEPSKLRTMRVWLARLPVSLAPRKPTATE